MRNSTVLLALSALATAAITANRFVSVGGATVAGDGVSCGGVARAAAAIGERHTFDVIGTAVVETGAAIAANALIQSDATGRAITKAAGTTVARLAPGEVATAAGQFVEVILLVNN